jgi:hypothetical protein
LDCSLLTSNGSNPKKAGSDWQSSQAMKTNKYVHGFPSKQQGYARLPPKVCGTREGIVALGRPKLYATCPIISSPD